MGAASVHLTFLYCCIKAGESHPIYANVVFFHPFPRTSCLLLQYLRPSNFDLRALPFDLREAWVGARCSARFVSNLSPGSLPSISLHVTMPRGGLILFHPTRSFGSDVTGYRRQPATIVTSFPSALEITYIFISCAVLNRVLEYTSIFVCCVSTPWASGRSSGDAMVNVTNSCQMNFYFTSVL